ncbi:uncharacterized protein LOC144110860 [Amblyomma americanum]
MLSWSSLSHDSSDRQHVPCLTSTERPVSPLRLPVQFKTDSLRMSECCPTPPEEAIAFKWSAPLAAQAPSSQSSSVSRPFKHWQSPSAFSGHGTAAAMQQRPMFFCFLVQMLSWSGLSHDSSDRQHVPCLTSTERPVSPLRLPVQFKPDSLRMSECCPTPPEEAIAFKWSAPLAAQAPSSQSSSVSRPFKHWQSPSAFSGHGTAAAMQQRPMFFCFLVQVSSCPSLHCKRTSNVNLLLVPCPSVLMCIVCECVYVLKLLLLGGDIEQNPGPPKKDSSQSNDDVVTLLKSLNEKIDKNHSEILSQLNEVRQTQTKLERQMASMNDRLVAVEEKVAASQASSAFDITQEVSEAVQNEAEAFHKRLDDLEDRSRRDNLLFHGLPDTQNETWDESEKLVREKLLSEMDLELPSEAIARAHRLGKFSNDKCRPVIIKFTNFKIREAVFTDQSKMKNAGLKVTEDFCLSTRNAHCLENGEEDDPASNFIECMSLVAPTSLEKNCHPAAHKEVDRLNYLKLEYLQTPTECLTAQPAFDTTSSVDSLIGTVFNPSSLGEGAP